MGWRSYVFSLAALSALAMGAWAQTAASSSSQVSGQQATTQSDTKDSREISAVQLPARTAQAVPRGSEGTNQPRYSVQNAPTDLDEAPAAAPTAKVSVAPADQPQRLAQPGAQPAQQAAPDTPRYARPDEHITVSALRGSEDGLYRLGTGDKLHVTVFNEGDLSGDFTIDGQGFVRLPLVGQVQAAGLTSFGLESRIADALIQGGFLVSPKVAVEIMSYRPFYILGEVSKPGEYAYVNAMSAPNAIALAGGYTDRAVQSTIYVRHQGETKERELPADESTRIYPGDVVRVRRSTYWAIMTFLSPIISPFATVAYLLK